MHCSVEQVVKLAPIMRHRTVGEGSIRRCNVSWTSLGLDELWWCSTVQPRAESCTVIRANSTAYFGAREARQFHIIAVIKDNRRAI